MAVIKDLGPLRIDHHVFGFTDVDTDLAGGLCAVGIEIVQRVLRLSQVGVARCSVVGEAQTCEPRVPKELVPSQAGVTTVGMSALRKELGEISDEESEEAGGEDTSLPHPS